MQEIAPEEPAEVQEPEAEAELAPEQEIEAVEAPPEAEVEAPEVAASEEDAGFAWLESLAAKQGADEETLTQAADQLEDVQPPDWVQEIAPEESAKVQEPEVEAEAPAETAQTVEPEELPGVPDGFEWLESLAAKQGADEETLVTAPKERDVTPPEWVQEIEPEQPVDMEDIETSVSDTLEIEPAAETPGEAAELEASIEDTQPIKVKRSEQADETLITPQEPVFETPQVIDAAGFVDQDIPDVEETVISDKLEPAPFEAEQVEEMPPEPVEEILHEPEAEIEAAEEMVEEASQADLLAQADQALKDGDLNSTLERIHEAAADEEDLSKVIDFINQALYLHPVEPELWLALGDVYAKDRHIQEAIDAYTKAEELIR